MNTQLDQIEARWFAVYTRYKREKLVQKLLDEKGVETYLPLQKVTRRYQRKIKHLQIPLLNCYVFTRITKAEYVPVLDTPDVLNFVRFAKELIAIPASEIDLLRRVTGEKVDIEVDQGLFHLGREVEIIKGSLTGLRGKLIESKGPKNFVVELENLGYSLRMEIAPEWLFPLQQAANVSG
jgi:transcription antitermination factor NusG